MYLILTTENWFIVQLSICWRISYIYIYGRYACCGGELLMVIKYPSCTSYQFRDFETRHKCSCMVLSHKWNLFIHVDWNIHKLIHCHTIRHLKCLLLGVTCNHAWFVILTRYAMNTAWCEIDNHGCYSIVKKKSAPICTYKNNWGIWRHIAITSRSHDGTDQLWWHHNAKSEKNRPWQQCQNKRSAIVFSGIVWSGRK